MWKTTNIGCTGNIGPEYVEAASPASSFDFNEFTNAAANSNFLPMVNGAPFTNDFLAGNMQMDLGAFPGTFDWVR
jgi:hypothetical protein